MLLRLTPNEIFCLKFTKELTNKDSINNLKCIKYDNTNYIYYFVNQSNSNFIIRFEFNNAELYVPVEVFNYNWNFVTSLDNLIFKSKKNNLTILPTIKWHDDGVCFKITCNINDIIEVKPNFNLCKITVLSKCHCDLLDKGGNNLFTLPLDNNEFMSFIVKSDERILVSTMSNELVVKVEKAV